MVTKADIEYQILKTLETEDEAYQERKKKVESATDPIFLAPNPYPEPREIYSARIVNDEYGTPYIHALITCGVDGLLGIRKLDIPIGKFSKPKLSMPKVEEKPKPTRRSSKKANTED